MTYTRCRLAAVAFSAAALLCMLPQAAAADFYAGKIIEIIVGSDVGGGYDIYSRAIARHMGRHIAGNPTIVVKNMPGAGSTRAAGYVSTVAAKDGTVLAAVFPSAVIGGLLDERAEALFDPTKAVYLGTAESGTRVCATFQRSKIKTFNDALTQKTLMGASAVGASTRDYALLHKNTSEAKFELVMGYKGSADILLAMERGEVDGLCGWDWSSVKSQRSDWLRDGKLNLLLQVGLEPNAELTRLNVPIIWSTIKNDDDRKAAELVVSQQIFQRPYLAPPGTPAEQVKILRTAFMATMQDRAFLEDAAKTRIEIAPLPGERVQDLVAKLYATPKAIVERAKQAIKP
jgi:tripartite-type tricarboxylate transporter receptor subunit TctC